MIIIYLQTIINDYNLYGDYNYKISIFLYNIEKPQNQTDFFFKEKSTQYCLTVPNDKTHYSDSNQDNVIFKGLEKQDTLHIWKLRGYNIIKTDQSKKKAIFIKY